MGKEKSITELKDEKQQLATRSRQIISEARAAESGAGRALTAAETEELNNAQLRMQEINVEIQERMELNSRKGMPHAANEPFSLRRAILSKLDGVEQRDTEARVIEEARKEHSAAGIGSWAQNNLVVPMTRAAYTAKTESELGVVIGQDQQEMLFPLQSALVLSKAGARMMTGLRGDIYWPTHSDVSVAWVGENAKAPRGEGEFGKGKVYKPLRLTGQFVISEQLLRQETISVEAMLRQRIAIAIAQKIEQTAFSSAAHTDTAPDGLYQPIVSGEGEDATTASPIKVSGAMTWANIVKMETEVDVANALSDNLAYIMHPSLIGTAKTKVKDASGAGGFIFNGNGDGILNGYKAIRTTNMPKELQTAGDEFGIIFGNWRDFFIGQWGAIDLRVDPYTLMGEAQVRLVVNSYWNMGVIRPESFCIGSMK